MRQIPLALFPGTAPSFANFLAGENGATLAQVAGHAAKPNPKPPLYLWGPPGSGKSHLLAALGRALSLPLPANKQAHTLPAAVAWFECGAAWGVAQVQALGHAVVADPASELDTNGLALVVLDACERLPELPEQQHAAFALFERALEHRLPFVAAGRLPPADLQVREDLRTRLAWGLVLPVAPLGEAASRLALQSEAARRGFFLGDEVLDYLLVRQARDLRALMQLLDRMDGYALAQGRHVTIPLVRQMLNDPES